MWRFQPRRHRGEGSPHVKGGPLKRTVSWKGPVSGSMLVVWIVTQSWGMLATRRMCMLDMFIVGLRQQGQQFSAFRSLEWRGSHWRLLVYMSFVSAMTLVLSGSLMVLRTCVGCYEHHGLAILSCTRKPTRGLRAHDHQIFVMCCASCIP